MRLFEQMTDSRAGEGKVEDAPGRHKQKSKNMLKDISKGDISQLEMGATYQLGKI